MDPRYPPHQMSYPNQQQMWANFYGSEEGISRGARFPGPEFDPLHMRMEGGGWWPSGHPHQPEMNHFPGSPIPGPWASQGPRPRGERPGPGRPRSTNKRERRSRRGSAGMSGLQQFPSPNGDGLLPEMLLGDNKRGPGRPKAMLDPNAPKLPGETTKNGKQKRYTCEVCQKKFSTGWYVRVHRRSHNGERPYVCTHCGKGFMLPNVLQVHLRKCEKNTSRNGQDTQGQKMAGPPGQLPPTPDEEQMQSPSGFSELDNVRHPQSHPFSGLEDFNQRFLGDLESGPGHRLPFNPGLPISEPSQFPPDHPGPPGHNFQHSPVRPLQRLSPIYSSNSNLPSDERVPDGSNEDSFRHKHMVTNEHVINSGTFNQSSEHDMNDSKEFSSSVSPPLPEYGATIQQFNSPSISPRKDLTKLADPWQTLPMLQ